MGLEISEEFWPNTPIRAVSGTARTRSFGTKFSDLEETKVAFCNFDDEEDVEECHTPKSGVHILKQPLVCPPPPKKSRPAKKKLSSPPQAFFQVPDNLESLFLVLKEPSKKN